MGSFLLLFHVLVVWNGWLIWKRGTNTSESMAFAKSLGLNPRMVYNIIRNTCGDSFMCELIFPFTHLNIPHTHLPHPHIISGMREQSLTPDGHRVPWQWADDGIPKSAMTIIAKDVGIVMDEARLNAFPAPLCAVVEQIFTAALGAGMAREDDGKIIKLYEAFGVPSSKDAGSEEEEKAKAKELEIKAGPAPKQVLFVGLGALGLPMASFLASSGVNVVGHDISPETVKKFTAAGGKASGSVVVEAAASDVVVLAVGSAAEAEAVLFGSQDQNGIASGECFPIWYMTHSSHSIEFSQWAHSSTAH